MFRATTNRVNLGAFLGASTLGLALFLVGFTGQARTQEETATQAEQPSSKLQAEQLGWWQKHGRPPIDYVTAQFADHDWVFLGEYHRIRDDVRLIVELIPRLHRDTRVRHLAMEFLCTDQTDQANELIQAPTFDRRQAIDFFRAQFVSWNYEEYLDIFLSAWRSNRDQSADRGSFHLIGLHPCPDYSVIHYGEAERAAREREKQEGYDRHMAATLETRILGRSLPALVFTGIAHSTARFSEYRFGTEEQLTRMGNLVYKKPFRDRMFFIAFHAPFWDAGTEKEIYPFDGILDRLMRKHGQSIGFDVAGTPFSSLVHENRSPHAITAYSFGELYDGYIMWKVALKETTGVTCIEDWIVNQEQFVQYWRHLSNEKASRRFSEMPYLEFLADLCAPRADHGPEFARRFRNLPDLD